MVVPRSVKIMEGRSILVESKGCNVGRKRKRFIGKGNYMSEVSEWGHVDDVAWLRPWLYMEIWWEARLGWT